jgi:hypothetical protein
MSKANLIQSEDFKEYQKALLQRLEDHYTILHGLLSMASTSLDAMQTKMIKLEALRAVIAEVELIYNLPLESIKNTEPGKAIAKKNGRSFLSIIARAFGSSVPVDEKNRS